MESKATTPTMIFFIAPPLGYLGIFLQHKNIVNILWHIEAIGALGFLTQARFEIGLFRASEPRLARPGNVNGIPR
ncbi:MAG TPA: hypothetical protein PK919_11635, partial [Candidatus Aminicenantes bacterium]|nr:hypothetical protein [Candidatus Aminicenantes bacterium]